MNMDGLLHQKGYNRDSGKEQRNWAMAGRRGEFVGTGTLGQWFLFPL